MTQAKFDMIKALTKCAALILIYAGSGFGKTTQIAELAEWLYRKQGLRTRLISRSGGGWEVAQYLVDREIIIPTDITLRWDRYNLLDKLSQGWWPADVTSPTSLLLPPPQLKSRFPNWKGEWQTEAEWASVGAIAYDGISEMCEWLMSYTITREVKGEIKVSGEKPSASFQDGDSSYGSPAMGQYNTIQNHISTCVTNTKALVGKYIVWTALELRAKDEQTGLPIYGPDIIGKAATGRSPGWFEQVLHGWRVNGKRRLYLTSHTDEYNIEFKAKNTASFHSPLSDYLEGAEMSLGVFLEKLDESKHKTSERLT